MKKYLNKFCALVGFLFLVAALPAQADPYHRGFQHHRHWHPQYGWVTPMIVGGVVTYVLTRPQPVVVQEPPVVIERDTRTVCSAWKEVQGPEGRIYRERTCQTVQD